MIEEIQKHKPSGATHWNCGTYYKKVNPVEWYFWEGNQWKFTSHIDKFILELTTL